MLAFEVKFKANKLKTATKNNQIRFGNFPFKRILKLSRIRRRWAGLSVSIQSLRLHSFQVNFLSPSTSWENLFMQETFSPVNSAPLNRGGKIVQIVQNALWEEKYFRQNHSRLCNSDFSTMNNSSTTRLSSDYLDSHRVES